jgi:hypothetical protein
MDRLPLAFDIEVGLPSCTSRRAEPSADGTADDRDKHVGAQKRRRYKQGRWTSFVMERERFDGADVAHLLRAARGKLDGERLLEYFGPHWRVLLSHLILFEFIYLGEPPPIPELGERLLERWHAEKRSRPTSTRLCQGKLLSRAQYLVDIEEWGYEDARLVPTGSLARQEVVEWTEAMAKPER